MTHHSDLDSIERDIRATRARLAAQLSVLASPSTYADLKDTVQDELLETRDGLAEKAKDFGKATAYRVLDDVKGRALANPAAALAIGAGIGWKLFKDPPIASALIALGVFSLIRTQKTQDADMGSAVSRLGEQIKSGAAEVSSRVADVAGTAQEQAAEWAGQARNAAGEVADQATSVASDFAGQARSAAGGVAGQAKQAAGELTDRAKSVAGDVADQGTRFVREFTDRTIRTAENARERLAPNYRNGLSDGANRITRSIGQNEQQIRDSLLVGVAGAAVATALGLAIQKFRNQENSLD